MSEQTVTTLGREGRALVRIVWCAVLACALLFSLAVAAGESLAIVPLATLPVAATIAIRAARMGIGVTPDAVLIRNPLWTHRVRVADIVELGLSEPVVEDISVPETIFVKTERCTFFSLLPASHEDLARVKTAVSVRVG